MKYFTPLKNYKKHVAVEMSDLRLFAVLFDQILGYTQTQIAVEQKRSARSPQKMGERAQIGRE